MPGWVHGSVLLGCALGLVACTSTSWEWKQRSDFRVPQRLYVWVQMTDQVYAADRQGSVAVLVDTLHREIWRRGYDVRVVADAEGELRYPRLELMIRRWNAGSTALRQLAAGFGAASVDVDCLVRLGPREPPVFRGRMRGSLNLGAYGTESTEASEAAAREIVSAVFDVKRPRDVVLPPAGSARTAALGAPVRKAHPAKRRSAPSANPAPPGAREERHVIAAPAAPVSTPSTAPVITPGGAPAGVPTKSFPVD